MAHILVIGGAGGLGSAVLQKLAARGDVVSATVLNDQEEAAVRAALPQVAAVHRLNLSDAAAVRADLGAVLKDATDVDAIIICVAISPYGPLETASIDVVRRTLEINSVSDVAIYQAAMPALRRTKGRLIIVSSMAGVVGMPFIGAYVGSKFALEGLADVMRREAAPQGVDIVLVEPGGIKTGMVTEQLRTLGGDIAALSDENRDRYGYLYEGFQALASSSHVDGASTPEYVADVVITALDAEKPAARYIAGPDAEQLIGLARNGSDADLDAAFQNMYGSARV